MITLADVRLVNVGPLLTWAIVAAVCSLLLIVEAGFLWWRSYQMRRRRFVRGSAVSAAVVAVGSAILAQRAWVAYLDYSSHGVAGRSPTLAAVLVYEQTIRQAIVRYQAAGWAAVALTAALLFIGVVAMNKAQATSG